MNPLRDSLNIIKKRRKEYYLVIALVSLLLFSQAFFAGQHLYRTDKESAEEFIEMIAKTAKIRIIASFFKEGRYVIAGTLIFLNNFLIDVFSMYLGIILIVPVFVLLSNTLVTGMVFGIESVMYPSTSISHIILVGLVGILEFSSVILITYEGLRIGLAWINPKIFHKKKRKDALKQNLKEGTKILFLVMLILIIAAIVEAISIIISSSKLIS